MLFDSKATYIRMILSIMMTDIPISYYKDNYMCIMFDIIQIILQYNMPRSTDLPGFHERNILWCYMFPRFKMINSSQVKINISDWCQQELDLYIE